MTIASDEENGFVDLLAQANWSAGEPNDSRGSASTNAEWAAQFFGGPQTGPSWNDSNRSELLAGFVVEFE